MSLGDQGALKPNKTVPNTPLLDGGQRQSATGDDLENGSFHRLQRPATAATRIGIVSINR